MNNEFRLEVLKSLLDGTKTKLLFFSGLFAGSVPLIFKYESVFLWLVGFISGWGAISIFFELVDILKKIEELDNANS